MPRVDHASAEVGLYVVGVYRRLRDRELERVSRSDPRLFLEGASGLELENAPRETPLLDLDGLVLGQPVTVPRWMVGGLNVREVQDWPVYADRTVQRFVVAADDLIRPA